MAALIDIKRPEVRALLQAGAQLDQMHLQLAVLLTTADQVHELLEGWRVAHRVDVVIPDRRADQQPHLRVAMADVDTDKEDVISRTWPHMEFEFEWCDEEDCP